MMEDFLKELNILLEKYPDLPETEFMIRPRISIKPKNIPALSVPTQDIGSIKNIPSYIPSIHTTTNTFPLAHDNQVISNKIKGLQKAEHE